MEVVSVCIDQYWEPDDSRIPLCSNNVTILVRSVSSVFRSKLGDLACGQDCAGAAGRVEFVQHLPGQQLAQQR
jgi:hypothetical protein